MHYDNDNNIVMMIIMMLMMVIMIVMILKAQHSLLISCLFLGRDGSTWLTGTLCYLQTYLLTFLLNYPLRAQVGHIRLDNISPVPSALGSHSHCAPYQPNILQFPLPWALLASVSSSICPGLSLSLCPRSSQ